MGFFSKLFDPGKEERQRAQQLAEQGKIEGGQWTGPGGMTGDWGFKDGQATGGFGLGMWADPQQQLIQQSLGMLGGLGGYQQQAVNPGMFGGAHTPFGAVGGPNWYQGMPQFQQQLGGISSAMGQLGAPGTQGFGMPGMQQNFMQNLQTAGQSPAALGRGYADMLHASEAGREQRGTRDFIEKVYGSTMGATSGAAERLGLHDKMLSEAYSGRERAGLEFGQAQQQFAQQQLVPGFGAMGQEYGRRFGEQLEGQQFLGNVLGKQADIAKMGYDPFRNLAQQQGQFGIQNVQQLMNQYTGTGQLGMGMYGQGIQADRLGLQQQQILAGIAPQLMQQAMGMNRLPLDYQNAMLQAAQASSGSYQDAASMQMQAAQASKSPLLEGLKMAGSVAGNVMTGGMSGMLGSMIPGFGGGPAGGSIYSGAQPTMSSMAGFGSFGQAAQNWGPKLSI
jgi:hypothetical protein